jgi:hypothetical protein
LAIQPARTKVEVAKLRMDLEQLAHVLAGARLDGAELHVSFS